MRAVCFTPLPIGVLPWREQQAMVTVVVKVSFALTASGVENDPLPITAQVPLDVSDGVRFKPEAEIRVVGEGRTLAMRPVPTPSPGQPVVVPATERTAEHSLALPTFKPVVFYAEPPAPWQSLSMACDTVVVDVDAGRLTLCWRAPRPAPPTESYAFLVLASGGSAATLHARLSEANWTEAAVLTETDGDAPPSSAPPTVRRGARRSAAEQTMEFEIPAEVAALPFRHVERQPSARSSDDAADETLEIDGESTPGQALPFDPSDYPGVPLHVLRALAARDATTIRGDTKAIEDGPNDEAPRVGDTTLQVPLQKGLESATPFEQPSAGAGSSGSVSERTASVAIRAAESATPFERPRAVVAHQPLASRSAPSSSEDHALPAESSPDDAAPRVAPRSTLDLDTYARGKAYLLDGEALVDVLEILEVDEIAWRATERAMVLEQRREARDGRRDLLDRLEAAIAAARSATDSSTGPEADESLAVYVAIQAEVDEAEDPAATLADLGLTAAELATLRKRWMRRAFRDPGLASELEERLATARRERRRVST